jgi:hypothetical protein
MLSGCGPGVVVQTFGTPWLTPRLVCPKPNESQSSHVSWHLKSTYSWYKDMVALLLCIFYVKRES